MAIETIYAGHRFRSRLEAKWAAFFTNIGWEWTYEPFDGNGYIPDFLIRGERPFLVEVKPAVTVEDYKDPIEKIEAGLRGHWKHDVLIVGADPIAPEQIFGPYSDGYISPGVLGDSCWFESDEEGANWHIGENGNHWSWDDSAWTRCVRCKQIGITSSMQSFANRPCSHYDGNVEEIEDKWPILDAWAKATNAVQWRPGTRAPRNRASHTGPASELRNQIDTWAKLTHKQRDAFIELGLSPRDLDRIERGR